jgi:hypothetical protein
VLESACTLAEMDSEKWDSWWAGRGLDGLTELLVAEWAPIWAGSDQPSRPDLHSEAIKLGKRWRYGPAPRRVPGLPRRPDVLDPKHACDRRWPMRPGLDLSVWARVVVPEQSSTGGR